MLLLVYLRWHIGLEARRCLTLTRTLKPVSLSLSLSLTLTRRGAA